MFVNYLCLYFQFSNKIKKLLVVSEPTIYSFFKSSIFKSNFHKAIDPDI